MIGPNRRVSPLIGPNTRVFPVIGPNRVEADLLLAPLQGVQGVYLVHGDLEGLVGPVPLALGPPAQRGVWEGGRDQPAPLDPWRDTTQSGRVPEPEPEPGQYWEPEPEPGQYWLLELFTNPHLEPECCSKT